MATKSRRLLEFRVLCFVAFLCLIGLIYGKKMNKHLKRYQKSNREIIAKVAPIIGSKAIVKA